MNNYNNNSIFIINSDIKNIYKKIYIKIKIYLSKILNFFYYVKIIKNKNLFLLNK